MNRSTILVNKWHSYQNWNGCSINANKALLIAIIKAEAFVPLHLKIEAVELVPNASGQWQEGPKAFMGTIQNEVNQSKPEAYNLDGSKVEKLESIQLLKASKLILSQWFSAENSQAISDAIELYGSDIKSHADLQEKSLEMLGTSDKRKIPIDSLTHRIIL